MRIYLSLVFGLICESRFVLTCSIKVPIYHCCCCSRLAEETFWCPNMLTLVSFAGSAVLWIGTLNGGSVQGESPPVLIKESHIQTYSRTSVCGRTYFGVVYRKEKKSLPTLPNFFGVVILNTHFFHLALLNMRNTLKKWLNSPMPN